MKMNITIANQTMAVEIGDLNARPIMATIGDETFEVWLEETATSPGIQPSDVSVARTGNMPSPASSKASASTLPSAAPANGSATAAEKSETAPLPGVITGIAVKPGASVKAGQELLDLEAMKMKNTIYSSREGVVAEILVSVGDSVRHGQILLKYT